MHRLLFFTDSPGYAPTLLFDALLRAVARRRDFEIVGVATTNPEVLRSPRRRHGRERARSWLASASDAEQRQAFKPPRPLDFPALAARHGFRIFVPAGRDVNSPAFVDELAKTVRPTLAFSCFAFQRFRSPLLSVFEQAVNYHDGALPAYRGTHATSWSVYRGESESGFSFHRMVDRFDAGNILVAGAVPIPENGNVGIVHWQKTCEAAHRIPALLDAIAGGKPGRPQVGPEGYFSVRDARVLRQVDSPEQLESDDLLARLRAFGLIHLQIGDMSHPVTKLEPANEGGALAFATKDGVRLRPTRFRHLPFALHRLRQRLVGSPGPASTDTRGAAVKVLLDPPLLLARDVALIAMQLALLPVAIATPEGSWRRLGRRAAAPLARFPTPAMRQRRTAIAACIVESGDGMTAAEIDREALARRFEQALQYLRCWLPGGWQPTLTLRGTEHLDRALANGRGGVLWVGPQLPAALGVKKALFDAGHPLHHLSSSFHGHSTSRFGRRFLNPIQTGAERRFLAERIIQDWGTELRTMRAAARCLRRNQLVSISCVPLGERLVRRRMLAGEMDFTPGVVSLALLTGAPLLPVFSASPESGTIEVTVEAPIEAPPGLRGREAVAAMVTTYAARVEAETRRDPASSLIWHNLA